MLQFGFKRGTTILTANNSPGLKVADAADTDCRSPSDASHIIETTPSKQLEQSDTKRDVLE